jgi:hypothetical protein
MSGSRQLITTIFSREPLLDTLLGQLFDLIERDEFDKYFCFRCMKGIVAWMFFAVSKKFTAPQ